MSKDIINSLQENFQFSLRKVKEGFSDFFEKNPENQQVVAKLFEGLPGLARQKKIQETIKTAKGGLQDLKNTIS
ncbi:MAG: hypothetical protein PHH16_02985 [Candidatus Gracilibacteria bacterium]|nr:hypothetical protein [Candidatus Gracilibacteria bacterium]